MILKRRKEVKHNIKELNDLLFSRVEQITSYLCSKFDLKLMINSNNIKEELFQKEFDIIIINIEVYFDKYEELIHEFLFNTKKEIEPIKNDLLKIGSIIENNIIYYVNWTINGYLNESEIKSFDFKNFDLSKFHSLKEKENLSSIININNIDEIERILSWISYYFYIQIEYFRFNKITSNQNKTDLTCFKSSLTDESIQTLFEHLNGNYIDEKTNPDHFKAIFKDEPLPNEFMDRKIFWTKSIPLFCCLLFGYKEIEYQGKSISFNGIIDRQTVHFYKKAINLFHFGTKKVYNKTLSEKETKLCYCNAPQNFDKLYPIIKKVKTSTV
ncbi:MAG: hypothetical protein KAT68_03930 [Bacteroidales bacterium]|nr:hypothetical protein [Bacteroidales bacterium]